MAVGTPSLLRTQSAGWIFPYGSRGNCDPQNTISGVNLESTLYSGHCHTVSGVGGGGLFPCFPKMVSEAGDSTGPKTACCLPHLQASGASILGLYW